MIEVINAHSRGNGRHGWLNSFHTFSFADYYNPSRMGLSSLRVLNDDTVMPGTGFGTHGHRNMEIISYVLGGRIAHKDNQGNVKELPAGEFQLMSAGRGITHSEYNASNKDPLHFLQIWIEPEVIGGTPCYQQKDFGRQWGLTKVVTSTGEGGTLKIKQDATLYQLLMQPGQTEPLTLTSGRKAYIHLIDGELELPGVTLTAGDGAQITSHTELKLIAKGGENLRALVFDLA